MKAAALILAALPAFAHVGSPDVLLDGSAGPYKLFVAIRPPAVIPGVAEIEVRASSPDVREIRVTPLPMTGPASKLPPVPDVAKRSAEDPQFYTASLWLMTSGSWQIRVEADGAQGRHRLSVPVPAVALRTRDMQFALGALLAGLGVLLSAGIVSILGAAIREGQLSPGDRPGADVRRRARRAMISAAVLVAAILYLGNAWWKAEANSFSRYVYKPLQMTASYRSGSLLLSLRDPGWLRGRRMDDFVPDHGHPMHLYALRLPAMDRVWHLHPELTGAGEFSHRLPAMPAGRYQLFGDVVHADGFPETLTARIDLPDVAGTPLSGDDSAGSAPPVSVDTTSVPLAGGGRMIWERDAAPLRAGRAAIFRFRVEDDQGKPARGLELYMGMQGHAAFVRRDLSVFAHVHPTGTVPMASLAVSSDAPMDPHAGHAMELPATVGFPYRFPQPGDYRIFVQIKRAGKVETAAFDARVEN